MFSDTPGIALVNVGATTRWVFALFLFLFWFVKKYSADYNAKSKNSSQPENDKCVNPFH